MIRLFQAHQHRIPAGARCLEWDKDVYARAGILSSCANDTWTFDYEEHTPMRSIGPRQLLGDLVALGQRGADGDALA
eukprot:2740485-Prymnesium_polylepis.1